MSYFESPSTTTNEEKKRSEPIAEEKSTKIVNIFKRDCLRRACICKVSEIVRENYARSNEMVNSE